MATGETISRKTLEEMKKKKKKKKKRESVHFCLLARKVHTSLKCAYTEYHHHHHSPSQGVSSSCSFISYRTFASNLLSCTVCARIAVHEEEPH